MFFKRVAKSSAIAAIVVLVTVSSSVAQAPPSANQPVGHTLSLPEQRGPYGPEEGRWRRQYWAVPNPEGALLRGVVFRPRGVGPFPLAILSHGTSQAAPDREKYGLPYMVPVMEWLVDQGYAVAMVHRSGVGQKPTAPFKEQLTNPCDQRRASDYLRSVSLAGGDIRALIKEMRDQTFVGKDTLLLVGHSGGGLASLWVAGAIPDDVVGVINFAGGRGAAPGRKPSTVCNEPALIAAFGDIGKRVKAPTLWVYAENDLSLTPSQAQSFKVAFEGSGGKADLRITPPFSEDGHRLPMLREGRGHWRSAGDDFLKILPR
jgi:dienelactone hydrolase